MTPRSHHLPPPDLRIDSSDRARNDALASDADRVAIARLKAGDISALDSLYHRHAPSLLQLARRLMGTRQDAEDIVHDVFADAPRAVRLLRHDDNVAGWLRTLATNRCIDRLRASARCEVLDHVALDTIASDIDRGDIIAAERIEAAIAALPSALRMVFVLRAIEGHSHAEIAETLRIRPGTSEVRYHRAIRVLRLALGDLR